MVTTLRSQPLQLECCELFNRDILPGRRTYSGLVRRHSATSSPCRKGAQCPIPGQWNSLTATAVRARLPLYGACPLRCSQVVRCSNEGGHVANESADNVSSNTSTDSSNMQHKNGQRKGRDKQSQQDVVHKPSPGEGFRKYERLKLQGHISRTQISGGKFILTDMVVYCVSNVGLSDVRCTRLTVQVSKKVSKRAVDRNLLRRRIASVFRRNKPLFPIRCDMVISVRPSLLEKSFEEVFGSTSLVCLHAQCKHVT